MLYLSSGMLSVHLITVFALERSFILFINNFFLKIPNYILFFFIFIAHVTRTSRTKHLSKTIESLNRYGKIFLNSLKFSKSTFIREILSHIPVLPTYSRSHKLFRTLGKSDGFRTSDGRLLL